MVEDIDSLVSTDFVYEMESKDIPRWWYLWYNIVRQKGITGEIPVSRAFEPDWAIFHLMYSGHSPVNLSVYLEHTYHELKEIYKN